MSKINVKGLSIYLYKIGSTATPTTPVTVTPTTISTGKVVTVTTASTTGLVDGQPITMTNTGYDEIDGKTFIVSNLIADTSFVLVGADTTGTSTAAIGVSPAPLGTAQIDADRVKLCLSSIDIAAPSVNPIDVSTFCGEDSIPGRATPGQITLGGYVEKDSNAFDELVLADTDGAERIFVINLANNNGWFLGGITLAGLGFSIPNEGAISYTISGTQSSAIKYIK